MNFGISTAAASSVDKQIAIQTAIADALDRYQGMYHPADPNIPPGEYDKIAWDLLDYETRPGDPSSNPLYQIITQQGLGPPELYDGSLTAEQAEQVMRSEWAKATPEELYTAVAKPLQAQNTGGATTEDLIRSTVENQVVSERQAQQGNFWDELKDIGTNIADDFSSLLNNPIVNPTGVAGAAIVEDITGLTYEEQLALGAIGGTAAAATAAPAAAAAATAAPAAAAGTNALAAGAAGSSAATNALIAGSSLASGVLGAQAADEAAEASERATAQTIAEQARQFDLTRADTAPYRQAGDEALNVLRQETGGTYAADAARSPALPTFQGGQRFEFDLEADQGYRFARDEGINAAERAMAARGMTDSGNVLAAISDRVTGTASQYAPQAFSRQMQQENLNYGRDLGEFGIEYQRAGDEYGRRQNYLGRMAGYAGMGQGGVSQSAAAGQSSAGNIGNALMANAQTQGAAAQAGYGAINQAVQGGVSNYMLSNYLNQPPQPTPANQYSNYGPYSSGYRFG